MAITLNQNLGTFSKNTSDTSIALTTVSAAETGSTIFVCVNYRNASAIVSNATDNGPGLSWAILNDAANNGQSRLAWLSAYAPAGMSSGTVITVNLTGAPVAIGNICAVSFSGVIPVSPLRASALGTTGTTTWSQSITTISPGDLVLGANTIISTTSTTNGADDGVEIHDFYGGANNRALATEYLVSGSVGSYTIAGTRSGLTSPSETVISLIALKAAATSSDTPFVMLGRGAC